MKRLIVACMIVALVSASLHAQNTQATYDVQQSTMRSYQEVNDQFQQRYTHNFINSLVNLTKLRGNLAQAWQSLGLSPQAAHVVANAYQPNLAASVHHDSLDGKSEQEIAAALQSALVKKDYMLANQTLIDYERGQLQMKSNTSPRSRH
jgi:hypothetical protein